MKKRFDSDRNSDLLRNKIIGLGERSLRKSYYPELQARLAELEEKNDQLKREIGERIKTQKALEESREKYKTLVDNQTDMVVKIDLVGRFLFASPSYCRFFSISEAELIGRNFAPLIHEEDLWTVQKQMEEVLLPPYSVYIEHRALTRDGWRWVAWMASAILDEEGRPKEVVATGRDISDRKQAEEDRNRLESQLHQAQKMEAIGTLAGGIAHDFNNLLQAITGYTEILLLPKNDQDPDYGKLDAIKQITERAAQLVQQLLLFSRKVDTRRSPVDINSVVEDTRRMLVRTIPKMIDIQTQPGSHLRPVQADRIQIERILLNLATNASHAMPDGGKLVIKTENVYLDAAHCKNRVGISPGEYVLISFNDTGEGIDPENLEHIFEPFYTTKEVGKGTGLGLASVYGIVTNHGGDITCSSELGRGTTFNIYLPALEQETVHPPHHKPQTELQGGTETILLVDDEASIRDFTSEVLKNFGYKVLTAESGEKALEIYQAQKQSIALVILDIGMPGMGGHQCLKELLQLNASTRFIIASGYRPDERVKSAMELGLGAFIGKPFQVEVLVQQIRSLLDAPAA